VSYIGLRSASIGSASRKGESDVQAIDSTQASITVETAMIARPLMSDGRRPTRSISALMTSTSAYIPTMCRLMTVKTSALLVVVCPGTEHRYE
jgi:hypothetical protein